MSALPVLVSDPEPSWLTPDTKQRFLAAASNNVRAAAKAAQATHQWRCSRGVDDVFCRACPSYSLVLETFPTYTLLEQNAEGHAVLLTKVGRIKELCELIFNPKPGGPILTMDQLEQSMALFNEFMVKVCAPKPLPAGAQVQIYDLEGFRLAHFTTHMITLFKLLVHFVRCYPGRLHAALIINAPSWFVQPWRFMSSLLDAHVSSRVVVADSAAAILPALTHHLGGPQNVPVAWGGSSTTPFHAYPAHQRMLEFAKRVNEGRVDTDGSLIQQQQQQQQQQRDSSSTRQQESRSRQAGSESCSGRSSSSRVST